MKEQQDEDRIKLAEAIWGRPKYTLGTWPEDFDPFTDANDDYTVLEWMRETYDVSAGTAGSATKRLVYVQFREAVYQLNNGYADGYKIGNYARAALEVIL